MLTDTFGRDHDYLRISLTDNCNLRCFYCMPEEHYVFTPLPKLMQADEIRHLAEIFVRHGVRKIRLTGGEPLVRKDAPKIIEQISDLPVELTMTTNATRLHDFTNLLKNSGVKSLNISLDTLNSQRFKKITGRDGFLTVKRNILSHMHDFQVKLNVVVMKGLNDDEILDFVDWTRNFPLHVRFIEFMPFQGNRWTSNQVFTHEQILSLIGEKYDLTAAPNGKNDTDRKYKIVGFRGSFAVISTMSSPFCSGCNRMRLTADGKMKNCLFSKSETDLLSALRQGKDVESLILSNILSKAKSMGGQFSGDFENISTEQLENRTMISIGG